MSASLLQLGVDLLLRVTSGSCDRGRLNAELAGAVAEARREEWSSVLALYDSQHTPGRRTVNAARHPAPSR